MKISRIKISNFKKISDLEVEIPVGNQVICFVGENGSNKSSVITSLYQLTRRTSKLSSPSDGIDIYNQSSYDISNDGSAAYYLISLDVTYNEKKYTTSEASIRSYDALSDDEKSELKKIFHYGMEQKDNFLTEHWSMIRPYVSKLDDIIEKNILLFRPSNRYETPSYEINLSEKLTALEPKLNISGKRKFPFRVESGIDAACTYLLDSLIDYFISMESKTPTPNLYSQLMSVLQSIDSDFQRLSIGSFPNRIIASKNLPSLHALSAGQSDWFITAVNILIQIADISLTTRIKDPMQVSGIVFIDEIDKNYHPKLQETIVPWFMTHFPNIQFVISSHSPYLIRSLGENCVVVKLPQGDVISEDFTYWDINEVSSKIFCRDIGFSPKVEDEIKLFKNFLREGKNHEAIEKYKFLSEKSASLKQELNRISYTLGNSLFIEAINEKS